MPRHARPQSIVNYVRRTSESVVLADAPADDRHGSDPYIVLHKPRSVMCVPVQKQGRLVGVLYLENRVLAGAFTTERIRIMQMLAAEAAIALENARLIDGLKREIGERQQAQAQLSAALAQVERLKDDLEAENVYLRSELITNVSHDLRTPLVSMRGYLEMLCAKGDGLAPQTRRSYLEIALRQSEHLATLDRRAVRAREARLQGHAARARAVPVRRARLRRDAEVPARRRPETGEPGSQRAALLPVDSQGRVTAVGRLP